MYFFIPHSTIARKRPSKSHTDYIVDITLELMDSLSSKDKRKFNNCQSMMTKLVNS